MDLLNEEEQKKIEEEEALRAKVRMRFEQKSSGLAGAMSGICPGLGQIYNGQLWKASLCFSIVFISLVLFVSGIFFVFKGMPTAGQISMSAEETATIEIDEEGMITDPQQDKYVKEGKAADDIPKLPMLFIVIGAIGIVFGRNYSIRDAIHTAKMFNNF